MAAPTTHSSRESAASFADALRAAIAASGLGLERIQHRLGRRGVAVSVATLSYWQSGRSRPGRTTSLAAVRELEAVLRLDPGSLAAQLEPPRPRGRWAGRDQDVRGFVELWRDPAAAVLERFANGSNDHLTRISLHDRFEIGPDRTERYVWTRQVMRADQTGPDRLVVVARSDEPGQSLPRFSPLSGCRLGRIRTDPDHGYAMTELMFDRALQRGETIVLEYETVHRQPYSVTRTCYRMFDRPIREYVAEVQFTPPALPSRCWQYAADEPHERARELTLDTAHRAHLVALSIGPGEYGMRWAW